MSNGKKKYEAYYFAINKVMSEMNEFLFFFIYINYPKLLLILYNGHKYQLTC